MLQGIDLLRFLLTDILMRNVVGWFKDFGYEHVEMLEWRLVPAVVRALFCGAVDVSGREKMARRTKEEF